MANPKIDLAFANGGDAYGDDKDLKDNPHLPGSEEHTAWIDGWKDAENNDPLADMFKTDDSDDEDEDEAW